jgi:multidrug efflux pump subunit AcrA (membrane-fusion protein)
MNFSIFSGMMPFLRSGLVSGLVLLAFVFCLPVALVLQGCGEKDAAAAAAPPPGAMAMPVTVEQLVPASFAIPHGYMARIDNRSAVEIKPRIMGYISTIHVRPGQRVKQGDLLISLDSRRQSALLDSQTAIVDAAKARRASVQAETQRLKEEVQSAEASVRLAQQTYDRVKMASTENAVSPLEMDQARTALEKARAERDALATRIASQQTVMAEATASIAQATAGASAQQEDIAYYEIRAPFSGVVGNIPVKSGAYVSMLDTLTTLTQPNANLEAVFEVPADALKFISMGTGIRIMNGGETPAYVGEVRFIESLINPETQTVNVRAVLASTGQSNASVRDGQSLEVQVMEPHQNALLIPVEAVTRMGNMATVYIPVVGEPPAPQGKPSGKKQVPGNLEATTPKPEKSTQPSYVAKAVTVELGPVVDNYYQLVNDALRPGDVIITGGVQKIREGAPIRIQKSPAEPAATKQQGAA